MKKQTYLISIIVVLILGFIFYWFSWRPTQIKKDCYNRAYPSGFSQFGKGYVPGINNIKSYESNYNGCLKEMGL